MRVAQATWMINEGFAGAEGTPFRWEHIGQVPKKFYDGARCLAKAIRYFEINCLWIGGRGDDWCTDG